MGKPRVVMVESRSLMDAETGAVLHRKERVEDAFDWFPDERGFKFGRRGKNIVRIAENPKKIPATFERMGMLHALIPLIEADGRMPSVGRMAKVLGLKERAVYDVLAAWRKSGIVKRSDGDHWMNPAYIFTGQYLPPALYALFQSDVDPLISAKARSKYALLLAAMVTDEVGHELADVSNDNDDAEDAYECAQGKQDESEGIRFGEVVGDEQEGDDDVEDGVGDTFDDDHGVSS